MKQKYLRDYKPGDKFFSRSRQMTEADVRMLIACSGAEHPLHTDPIYASKQAIGKPIMQGALILGVVDAFFSESVFNTGEPALTYGYEKIRFIRPDFINDVIRAEFELFARKEKDVTHDLLTFNVTVLNQNDTVIFSAVETFIISKY